MRIYSVHLKSGIETLKGEEKSDYELGYKRPQRTESKIGARGNTLFII